MSGPRDYGNHERLTAAALMGAMIAGAAVVWIGLPIGCMWLAGELTDEFGVHMPLAMAMILPSVVIGSLALAWLNNRYLEVTRSRERVPDNLWRLQRSGPLERILFAFFLLGLAAFAAWFLFIAENPPRGVF